MCHKQTRNQPILLNRKHRRRIECSQLTGSKLHPHQATKCWKESITKSMINQLPTYISCQKKQRPYNRYILSLCCRLLHSIGQKDDIIDLPTFLFSPSPRKDISYLYLSCYHNEYWAILWIECSLRIYSKTQKSSCFLRILEQIDQIFMLWFLI